MKYNSFLLPALLLIPSLVSAKNVVDVSRMQFEDDENSQLDKRDAKRITSEQDLKISPDDLDRLMGHRSPLNPLKKRSGIIIEPNVRVVHGSVEDINDKQKLFEQGVDVIAEERQQQPISESNSDEVHILSDNKDSLFSSGNTLAKILNSGSTNHIFSNYVRSIADIEKILDDNSYDNIIVLTPTDDAIASLPLKPWQFPTEIDDTNNSKDEISTENISTFIKSHIITDSTTKFDAISEGGVLMKTMQGSTIKMYRDKATDDLKIVVPGYEDQLVINVSIAVVGDNGVSMTVDHVLEWPGM